MITPTLPLGKSHFQGTTCLHWYLVGPSGLGVGHWTLIQRVLILRPGRCTDFSAHTGNFLSTKHKNLGCEKNGTPTPLFGAHVEL